MQQTYTYTHPDGTQEPVQADEWTWIAVYGEGRGLSQYDTVDLRFHKFAEIDLGALKVFAVQHMTDPTRRFEIHMKPGMRPIFFYRTFIEKVVGSNEEVRTRLVCFGYQETVNGRNVKSIVQLWPNGAVALLNHDGREG